jgi:hypothetical protein
VNRASFVDLQNVQRNVKNLLDTQERREVKEHIAAASRPLEGLIVAYITGYELEPIGVVVAPVEETDLGSQLGKPVS